MGRIERHPLVHRWSLGGVAAWRPDRLRRTAHV